MRPKRWLYWLFVLAGIAGMAGLTVWNLVQVRNAALTRNERWVNEVADLMSAERQSLVSWIEHFPIQTSTFRDIANSRENVAGLFLIDQKTHRITHWTRPGLPETTESIDPHLSVLQLQSLEKQQVLSGPLIFAKGKPYFSVARPLDHNRVLLCLVDASRTWTVMETEAKIWHVHTAIYDFEMHPVFASNELTLPASTLDQAARRAHNNEPNGILLLPRQLALQWLVTFHYNPGADWIFIAAQRAYWTYMPVFFFLLCVLGMLLLARIPFISATAAHREGVGQAISSFAKSVDSYIRGQDGMLADPPYHLKELGPIATSVRWLLPQWKKAEAFPRELALERKLLSLLVESLPEGILFFNAQGGMQLSNELGRVFLALETEGREARMVAGVQVPRGFLEPFLEPVFTGAQPNLGKEVEVAWADGKHLYRLWVEKVEAEPGKSGGFIVVVRDITFRKQWEYVQEQVLSGITHDLRGPLSAVLGYIDLMKRQLGDSAAPKVTEYLRLAREAGVRLSQMVSDILDVVRFEQGKIEMTVESIPVVELFQRLKDTFNVLAEQKKVTLKLAILGDSAINASADRKLLERVLDNLVGNAIKFTPPDGSITVTAKNEKNRVFFDVVDTGRGIPREAQSRIFDKFQQVRPGDRSAGYGLGLAVAKFIIEAHKGEIRVESEVGVGSRFTFWLPNRAPDVPNDGGLVNIEEHSA